MFGKKIFSQTHQGNGFENSKVFNKHASILENDLRDKVEDDKRTCLKKIFSQTHQNKAGNGFENSKGAYNRGYSKHFGDMTSGTKLKKMIRTCLEKKFFLKLIRIRQKIPRL